VDVTDKAPVREIREPYVIVVEKVVEDYVMIVG
jgi:hypothetical protein